MTQPDLHDALSLASHGPVPPADPAADLARARAALTRRRRRRYSTGLAAMALVAVGSVGVGIAVNGDDSTPTPPAAGGATTPGAVQLVDATFDAAPYTFDLTPQGWSVQARTPYVVTIVPDGGDVSDSPDDFVGKLVISFDSNPLSGRKVERDGRSFWVGGDSGYTIIATPTLPGEPDGVVNIQFPKSAGWTEDSMLAFLGSVHVGPGARQSVG